MSDFKTPNDFRKGSYRKFPYQDPTYLSFALMFDVSDTVNSPFFAGPAEKFLEDLAKSDKFYEDRLADFRAFKKALLLINLEMPWYWQSIKGVERLQQYNPLNAYRGGDDAKLEIETLESLNLPIAGLMHLYRRAIFDERKWNYILPANLRKFRLYIYITEIRSIQINTITKVNGIPSKLNVDAISGFPGNFKPEINVQNKNADIMGPTGRPYFMVGVTYCEFDILSGTNIFADLSKNPESNVSNSITITYENVDKVEARVLTGIIEEKELPYTIGHLAPAPESEIFKASTKTAMQFAKDKINGRIDEISKNAKDQLKQLGEEKKRELLQTARDKTINRIPRFENVFQSFIRATDNATDIGQLTKNVGNAINANVLGITPGQTFRQGLDKAAINNLGNVYD